MRLVDDYDKYWMYYALILAKYAEILGEIPVGAVLINSNHIIGIGWNCSISKNDSTAHAEIIALQQGGKFTNNYRLLNTTMYVTLEPCIMCIGALINARVKKLVFGAKNNKVSNIRSVIDVINSFHINHKIFTKGGILNNLCSQQLKNFFKKRR